MGRRRIRAEPEGEGPRLRPRPGYPKRDRAFPLIELDRGVGAGGGRATGPESDGAPVPARGSAINRIVGLGSDSQLTEVPVTLRSALQDRLPEWRALWTVRELKRRHRGHQERQPPYDGLHVAPILDQTGAEP
jgi:hypothetical protein